MTDRTTGWREVADLAKSAAREWVDPPRPAHNTTWSELGTWLRVVGTAYIAMCLVCVALIVLEWLYFEVGAAVTCPGSLSVCDLAFLRQQIAFSFKTSQLVVAAVLFGYSLAWSAPIALGLIMTGVHRLWPRAARLVWMTAFQAFTVLIGLHPFGWRDRGGVCLGAASWVLARSMFPRHESSVVASA